MARVWTELQRCSVHRYSNIFLLLNQVNKQNPRFLFPVQPILLNPTQPIFSIQLSTSSGSVNILNIYSPTLCFSDETKDEFYKDLETTVSEIPDREHLYMLGDFNAGVGD